MVTLFTRLSQQHDKGRNNFRRTGEGRSRYSPKGNQSDIKGKKPILDNADSTPIIMAGDFNSNSHLDWTEATKETHLDYVVEWPVTKVMHNHGFTDSFRELNPNPLTSPGYSAWPYNRRFGQRYVESRIDYIFYKGKNIRALESKVVNYHPIMFPSDHAAFLTIFQLK